jgi:hypothetical protein
MTYALGRGDEIQQCDGYCDGRGVGGGGDIFCLYAGEEEEDVIAP